jgi:hypothetical protein
VCNINSTKGDCSACINSKIYTPCMPRDTIKQGQQKELSRRSKIVCFQCRKNLCSSQFDPTAEERLLGHIGMHQVCAGCRPMAAKMDCARYIWSKGSEYSLSSYFRCTVPACVWAISGRSIIRPVMMQHMTRHKARLHLDSLEEFPEPVQVAMRNATQDSHDSDDSDGNEDSNDFYKDGVDSLKVLNAEDEVEDEDHKDLDTFDEDHAVILQGINDSDKEEDEEPESDRDNVEDLLGALQEMSEAQLPTSKESQERTRSYNDSLKGIELNHLYNMIGNELMSSSSIFRCEYKP